MSHKTGEKCRMPEFPRMWQHYTCPDCETRWTFEGLGIWKGEGGENL